jgi:hypothetical protein
VGKALHTYVPDFPHFFEQKMYFIQLWFSDAVIKNKYVQRKKAYAVTDKFAKGFEFFELEFS